MLKGLLVAIQFLTVFPVGFRDPPGAREWGMSVAWYPLVGALIGALLWAIALMLPSGQGVLEAAIVLALWVFASGALHLDGLADCADAWVGGFGDRERSLAIMKDPRSGPVAVVVVVVVLLLKFAALSVLLPAGDHWVLLAAPVLARGSAGGLLAVSPYVRSQGIASAMIADLPRVAILAGAGLCVLAVGLFWSVPAALISGLTLVLIRFLAMRRLAGITGDVAGALVEISETAILLAVALAQT
ncbi:MAG: adenosylcobinamide-GDP ribazoletransferase [Gammaproteobacteria bacterium]|nr:adenosylcobinamide-GDP ribazoletransferase [Gammaproteobacteria bacterium]